MFHLRFGPNAGSAAFRLQISAGNNGKKICSLLFFEDDTPRKHIVDALKQLAADGTPEFYVPNCGSTLTCVDRSRKIIIEGYPTILEGLKAPDRSFFGDISGLLADLSCHGNSPNDDNISTNVNQ